MPEAGPSAPSSGRPKRNPHFSDTSHLIVLRDHKETKGSRDASDADTSSTQARSRRRDWSSLPLGPGTWLDTDTPPRPPRHMAFHDGIQQELAARSRLFAGQCVSKSPPLQDVPCIKEPPSFFMESFPDALTNALDETQDTTPPDETSVQDTEPHQEESITVHHSPHEQSSSMTPVPKFQPGLPDSSSLVFLMPLPPSPTLQRERRSQTLAPAASTEEDIPEECFANEVRIRGWQRIGSYARGWVAYEVVVTTKSVRVPLTQGLVLQLYKRYTSFMELRQRLAAEAPQYARALPALPPRHTGLWHKYLPTFLETRRRALQRWLDYTLLDSRWGSTRAYRDWVLER